MKKIVFKELQLCSFKEQKALKITLGPKRNLILGANDTGKSCLMKSFYHALGANVKFEDSWTSADVKSLITFEYEGTVLSILRDQRTYSVYDHNLVHLKTFTSISKGLGPYLAELFNFGLKLLTKEDSDDVGRTPSPAYMFLPFYIDQDKGWSKSFDSFEYLSQYKDYRNNAIEYHTGIRPNDYYETKIEIKLSAQKIQLLEKDIEVIGRILNSTRDKYKEISFDIDVESFKKEIEELLQDVARLNEKESEYKNEMRILYDEKYVAEHQLSAVTRALNTVNKDFDFTVEHMDHGEISCPTCNTTFSNDFASRLEIAKDINQFDQLQSELQNQIFSISDRIEQTRGKLTPIKDKLLINSTILAEKSKSIELQDIIRSEGRREVIAEIKNDRDRLLSTIDEIQNKISVLEIKIESYADKKRTKSILDFYILKIKKHLSDLDVHNIPEKKYKKITSVIEKSGSDKPRALLAYFLAIVETINKFSTFVSSPVVIDSPNQQAQDQEHLTKILELIRDQSPKDSQVILAVEDLHDVKFDWPEIKLSNKLSLLGDKDYQDISALFRKLQNSRVTS